MSKLTILGQKSKINGKKAQKQVVTSPEERRMAKAKKILEEGLVERVSENIFKVQSQASFNGAVENVYDVKRLDGGIWTCTCIDNSENQNFCKHCMACQMFKEYDDQMKPKQESEYDF